MKARRRGHNYQLLHSLDDVLEDDDHAWVPKSSHGSPWQRAITSVLLLVTGIVFLLLSLLHVQGALKHHTPTGAGWGLLALGVIAVLPGAVGTHKLYKVFTGQEQWEHLAW